MHVCMAHRGWSGKAPENTMAAIQLALGEPGVQAIEIDVQVTKDGELVLMHDFTVDRTTNGAGPVKEHTLAEIQSLDAGSWFGTEFVGERVPTLGEVLVAMRGRCMLNIELKTAGDLYPDLAQKVVELVTRHEMQAEVIITSFDHEAIRRVHELDPTFTTGLIIYGKPTLLTEQLWETGATVISIAYPYVTAPFVRDMHEQGYQVLAWTVDDEQSIENVLRYHPDIHICTNHPDRMIGLLLAEGQA